MRYDYTHEIMRYDYTYKRQTLSNIGGDVEQLEVSYSANMSVNL